MALFRCNQSGNVVEFRQDFDIAEMRRHPEYTLEAQVEVLHGQVSQLSSDVRALLELANQSKGGFWMGMVIASALSGIVSFFAARWLK